MYIERAVFVFVIYCFLWCVCYIYLMYIKTKNISSNCLLHIDLCPMYKPTMQGTYIYIYIYMSD